MKILLIRHGETDWNTSKKIQGRTNIPLNEAGLAQAKGISDKLKNVTPSSLYATSLDRSYQTMKVIKDENAWNHDIIINDDLIERSFGDLEGSALDNWYKIDNVDNVRNYECNKSLYNRSIQGLNNIVLTKKGTAVIVTHSHTIQNLIINLYPNKYNWDNFKLKNCAIVELAAKNNTVELISIY